MQADTYSQQLEEELSFIKQIDYIKAVLDNTLNLDKLDRNDLYELVYINEKLNKWLKIGIVNADTYSAVKDLSEKVSFIVDNLSNETLEKALEAKIDTAKSKKINIKKYNETTKLSELKDRSDIVERPINALEIYLRLRAAPLLSLVISSTILILGLPSKLGNLIIERSNAEARVSEIATQMSNFISSLSSTLIILLLMFGALTLCYDLMYLTMPSFKKMMNNLGKEGLSLNSPDAKLANKIQESLPSKVAYKSIELKDKLEISEVLLGNMQTYMNEYREEFNTHINNNEYLTTLYNNTDNLRDALKVLKNNCNKQNGIARIKNLAQTELIYDDFSNIIEEIESIKDKEMNLRNDELEKNISSMIQQEVTTDGHQNR